jgi:NCAIR mutase (PurE)-related protein
MMLASAVDWAKLLEVVWTAALAGIGVTAIFSLAVFGMARSLDTRTDRPGASALYAVVGLAGFAASLAAIVWGVVLITSK